MAVRLNVVFFWTEDSGDYTGHLSGYIKQRTAAYFAHNGFTLNVIPKARDPAHILTGVRGVPFKRGDTLLARYAKCSLIRGVAAVMDMASNRLPVIFSRLEADSDDQTRMGYTVAVTAEVREAARRQSQAIPGIAPLTDLALMNGWRSYSFLDPTEHHTILANQTMAHEMGHAAQLDHSAEGSGDLMATGLRSKSPRMTKAQKQALKSAYFCW